MLLFRTRFSLFLSLPTPLNNLLEGVALRSEMMRLGLKRNTKTCGLNDSCSKPRTLVLLYKLSIYKSLYYFAFLIRTVTKRANAKETSLHDRIQSNTAQPLGQFSR